MGDPEIIIIDCDGVLTDGKFWVTSKGEISKGFHTNDVFAIKELTANGYEVYVVTASSWPGMNNWAKKTGAKVIIARDKSNLTQHIGNKPYIAIGDSPWDIAMLNNAKASYVPADAIIRTCDSVRLITKGGEGVIAELLKYLL